MSLLMERLTESLQNRQSAKVIENGIRTVYCASAWQGMQSIIVRFELNKTAVPAAPPAIVLPDEIRIGSVEGHSLSREGNTCSALFDISADEVLGVKTVEIYFTGDPSSIPDRIYRKTVAFEVLPQRQATLHFSNEKSDLIRLKGCI